MKTPACPPFVDNWSYVKAELQWLDRLLVLAVGKSRRERRELDKVSRDERDRVTKHWWKGIVALEGPPLYEDGRPAGAKRSGNSAQRDSVTRASGACKQTGASARASTGSKRAKEGSYQQQIEARIRATQARGVVVLGLPELRDRLKLTPFEKKLLLLGLAPEVNRRYARLYGYLQETKAQELPQVDLALKLLCRNDQEWSIARRRLAENSPLLQTGLVSLVAQGRQPLLTQRIQLSPQLVNYLLASPVDGNAIDQLLDHQLDIRTLGVNPGPLTRPILLERSGIEILEPYSLPMPATVKSSAASSKRRSAQTIPKSHSKSKQPDPWKPLIVSRSLKRELQHLSQRLQLLALDPPDALDIPLGTLILLTGTQGSGKTTAVRAVAQAAQTSLLRLNLAALDSTELAIQFPQWVQAWQRQAPTVLLIQAAERLLEMQSPVSTGLMEQWLEQRRRQPSLTFFSTSLQPRIVPRWQRQCDRILSFPFPDVEARKRLWTFALSADKLAGLALDQRVSCAKLAQQGKLTGAEIVAIAREAVLYAKVDQKTKLTTPYIQRAWRQRQANRS